MSEITYRQLNDKRILVTADYDKHCKFLRTLRGRYYKKKNWRSQYGLCLSKRKKN